LLKENVELKDELENKVRDYYDIVINKPEKSKSEKED